MKQFNQKIRKQEERRRIKIISLRYAHYQDFKVIKKLSYEMRKHNPELYKALLKA